MKNFILILFCLLVFQNIKAQQSQVVAGHIISAATNEPVSLTTVSALKSNAVTT